MSSDTIQKTNRDFRFTFYDKEDRPWPSLRLTSSAIVGHTTDTTSRIWVRVSEPGSYCLLVSEQEIPKEGRPGLSEEDTPQLSRQGRKTLDLPGSVLEKQLDFSTDLTGVFDLTGLRPATRYHYALFSKDGQRREKWEVGRDAQHSFKTQASDPQEVTFGLFSCHMPFKGRNILNMDMWTSLRRALASEKADFIIGAGDQVYCDGDDSVNIWRWLMSIKDEVGKLSGDLQVEIMKSWYRDIYRGYWGDRELRRVFRNNPTYMIWDDHEIMDGWGSHTNEELANQLNTIMNSLIDWVSRNPESARKNRNLAYRMFEAAKFVYQEYQHSHNPATPAGQWDYSFDWGPLSFYVLDVRGHRDFNRPRQRILGSAQWSRLEAWFRSRSTQRAATLCIVSPVPVVHLSEFIVNVADLPALALADDLRDEWEHATNWTERSRLLDLVFEYSARSKKRVIFLSGDVHVAAAFRLWRPGRQRDARVYQLTSSAISYCKTYPGIGLVVRKDGKLSPESEPTRLTRLQEPYTDNNFAIVKAKRTTGSQLDIVWDVYGNAEGLDQVIRHRSVKLT